MELHCGPLLVIASPIGRSNRSGLLHCHPLRGQVFLSAKALRNASSRRRPAASHLETCFLVWLVPVGGGSPFKKSLDN